MKKKTLEKIGTRIAEYRAIARDRDVPELDEAADVLDEVLLTIACFSADFDLMTFRGGDE